MKKSKKKNNEFSGYEIVCNEFISVYVKFYQYRYGIKNHFTYSYNSVHNSQMVFNV